ncbi:MAG: hypothetical protein V7642_1223 [Burkholderiales bacterium]|jgi:uncharacterized membrane protein
MEASATNPGSPGVTRPALPRVREHRSRYPLESQRYKTYGYGREEQLAKGLGWFSIGLGLAHLVAPRAMARATGMPDDRTGLMRAVGVRELASGVGILRRSQPTTWLWTRVAGDAMDLTLLGLAATKPGAQKNRIAAASMAVAGVTVLDVLSSVQISKQQGVGMRMRNPLGGLLGKAGAVVEAATGTVNVTQAITVNRPAIECYRFWHDFENFPRFMKHVQSVQRISDTRWHWKARGPAGISVEWDAEITEDKPGEVLAWRSVEGSEVDNSGRVRFEAAPAGRGTIVRVEMQYRPPGGKAGALIAKLFGEEPSQQISEDLRRFKQLIETGEIPTTVGQPSGRRDTFTRLLLRKGKPG